jgi:hypothetical protein
VSKQVTHKIGLAKLQILNMDHHRHPLDIGLGQQLPQCLASASNVPNSVTISFAQLIMLVMLTLNAPVHSAPSVPHLPGSSRSPFGSAFCSPGLYCPFAGHLWTGLASGFCFVKTRGTFFGSCGGGGGGFGLWFYCLGFSRGLCFGTRVGGGALTKEQGVAGAKLDAEGTRHPPEGK